MRLDNRGNPVRLGGPAAAAAVLLAVAALSSCGARPSAPARSAAQQEFEVLFRLMQAAWNQIFTAGGAGEYVMARLEFFSGEKETPCGKAAGGISYCPKNRTVFVNREWLEGQPAPEPALRAYLLARHLARHVQHQLTIDERVDKAIEANPRQKNVLLRKRELQADCFVGLWRLHHEQPGPAPEALKQALRLAAEQGREELLSSTLEERLQWFGRGLQAGEIAACNIFSEPPEHARNR